jgi:hypothetical protein
MGQDAGSYEENLCPKSVETLARILQGEDHVAPVQAFCPGALGAGVSEVFQMDGDF